MALALKILEYDFDSVTLMWSPLEVERYELQMLESGAEDWAVLSSNISKTTVRKKNLAIGKDYSFRVRAIEGEFSNVIEDFRVVDPATTGQMNSPTFQKSDECSISLQWTEVEGAEGYCLRFRCLEDMEWQTVATIIKGGAARKKGLMAGRYYTFSIKPIGCVQPFEWSLSSSPFQIASLSAGISRLFPSSLLAKTSLVPTENILGGASLIGVYFSASWCGPCRAFTPQLAALYEQVKGTGIRFEIVFCSADSDSAQFESYFKKSHPWAAIPFDSPQREELQSMFNVSGIPKLSILSKNGRIVVDNAAQSPLTIATVQKWAEVANEIDRS